MLKIKSKFFPLTGYFLWTSKDSTKGFRRTSTTFDGLGIPQKVQQAEAQSADPQLWKDPKKAEKILKELKYWKDLVEKWNTLRQKAEDLSELSQMIHPDNKEEGQEVEKDYQALAKAFQKAHVELLLSGEYDPNDALLVVSAGTGGVEAQDWAEMLLRMYLRYFERQGWKAVLTDKQVAEEAGIKSATVEVKGLMAYGYLKAEHGVHRLVRLSPFNAKNLRQTSFALVEVLPILEEDQAVEINEADLRVDTFRASGAGGQHVNTTDSAVRLTHLPTGIVVNCQTERSQIQNRARAMAVLQGRLTKRLLEEKKERIDELKGGYKEAAWGNQIRSYVFQPYTMVKDHRTGVETSQVQQVMDGELEDFVEGFLAKGSGTP